MRVSVEEIADTHNRRYSRDIQLRLTLAYLLEKLLGQTRDANRVLESCVRRAHVGLVGTTKLFQTLKPLHLGSRHDKLRYWT